MMPANHHSGPSCHRDPAVNSRIPAILPATFTVYASTRFDSRARHRPSCWPGPVIANATMMNSRPETASMGMTNLAGSSD
jgi:hypothetical protein